MRRVEGGGGGGGGEGGGERSACDNYSIDSIESGFIFQWGKGKEHVE